MTLESLLHESNPWWEDKYAFADVIERDKVLTPLYPLLMTPDVVLLTGLRRVGKTVTMKCLIRYLIEHHNISPQHCCYISMDEYQLRGKTLFDVLDAYRQCMKLSVKEKVYMFFDEITYIEDFQHQLKNLYDRGNQKCIVSSSSSSLLKDDSAYLTGRKRIIEINPLDFEEYLQFKGVVLGTADKGLQEQYFLDYMQIGGMPEYVLNGDRDYLMSLVDDILMKDIVARHKIRHPDIIRQYFILLMERAGKQISINKIANILGISPDTASRYLGMFEDTYLIHLVSRFGKTNETLLSQKKVYATDLGMRHIVVGFRDKGAIFENIVFMKIKHRQPKYLYVDGQEIDFIYDDTLLEAKFNRDLEGKQLKAFENYSIRHKKIVHGCLELDQLAGVC
ncbi:MAG: ATPase [marine bacterium B5-7]|nr:MAG: ATPase [marine bacterium B5-7]